MNSSGADIPSIFDEFVDSSNIHEAMSEYDFTKWYPFVKELTPESIIVMMNTVAPKDGADKMVDDVIRSQFGGACFARLDRCSSKPDRPFHSASEIRESLRASGRTAEYMHNASTVPVILREWLANIRVEFRCFVLDGKLRAISVNDDDWIECVTARRTNAEHMINTIIRKCDYDDASIDLCLHEHNGALVLALIEINTPVYMFATSGKFDLEQAYDYAILLGDYDAELIQYPVIR